MKHYRDRQVYAQIEALTEIGLPVEMVEIGVAAETGTETVEAESPEMEMEHATE
jgi:hypothetical protein